MKFLNEKVIERCRQPGGLVLVSELLGECWFRREGLGRRLDEALSVPKKGRRKA